MIMKNKIAPFLVIATLILSFISCVDEDDFDSPPPNTVSEDEILSVADIYQIYQDSGENYTFQKEYMLYGDIIMSDATGNIYKEAYLQDTSGGINLYKLSSSGLVHEGEHVRVNLKDVSIVDYQGKLELVFDDILNVENRIIVQSENNDIQPYTTTISEIKSGKYDCELIKLDSVQFANSELNKTYAEYGGTFAQNRTLKNCSGKSIVVRTSDYADFATDTLAQGNGSIIGVITKYNEFNGSTTWQLLIRNLDEVNLDGARCDQ